MTSKRGGAGARLFRAAVPVFLLLLMSEACADMFGWFKQYEVLLSPEVQGVIKVNGVPAGHVKVFRETTYDEHTLDSVFTDSAGRFNFPPRMTRSTTPGKPLTEARLRQIVLAEYQGKKHILWYYVTARTSGEVVIADKLGSLHCDLADDEIDHHFISHENPRFTHNISSICRW